MAKKAEKPGRTPSVAPPGAVEVRYDLTELPTAQHKAGLAGLVLTIRSLEARSRKAPDQIPPEEVPEIVGDIGETQVRIRFTERSVRRLFDDLYAATFEPGPPQAKPKTKGKGKQKIEIPWSNRAPLTIRDKKTGSETIVDGYVYPQLIPRLTSLEAALPPIWLKLWRDSIFAMIRDSTKRGVYQKRASQVESDAADDEVDGEDETDDVQAEVSFAELATPSSGNGRGTAPRKKLSSALLLGGQSQNAELVEMSNGAASTLLLHFWPVSMLVFVPSFVDKDGVVSQGKLSRDDKAMRFVLAIPDVASVASFCSLYQRTLSHLDAEAVGYRPRDAIVCVPAESALEFLRHASDVAGDEGASRLSGSIRAIELFHMLKADAKAQPKIAHLGRVAAEEWIITAYRGLRDHVRNPLFRAARILALLRGKPWWGEMLPLFASRDWHFFLPADDTQEKHPAIARLPWFWADVRRQFQIDAEILQLSQEIDMPEPSDPLESEKLSTLLNQVVYAYVTTRAEQRSGVELDKFKTADNKIDWERVPKEFKDKRAETAQSLFLEFRSRRDQAFVNHFAQTFFACKQYLTNEDSTRLAALLLERDRLDDVKALTLLALSRNA